jgi:molecular chaperone DnaK
VISNTGALSAAEIKNMREEAEQYATEDNRRLRLFEIQKQMDNLLYGYELALEKDPRLISNQLQQQIATTKQKIERSIQSNSLPVNEIESMMENFRELILKVGSESYESLKTSGVSIESGLKDKTFFESDLNDDDFKTIEEEILSGLNDLSQDFADDDFNYEQEETITGDYEIVD